MRHQEAALHDFQGALRYIRARELHVRQVALHPSDRRPHARSEIEHGRGQRMTASRLLGDVASLVLGKKTPTLREMHKCCRRG
ncbi:hypothetical protein LMG27177_01813 [Paraburkholderia fynbosensis]|uniref:Uncharacterized protein n=1 Tax=Paraburkholderia fynbosensis TaxID=1200993 RepID=A0A6J5FRF3_9BURK|nr:hypothetical protein LMG27177_01813 [Paraburkholderia fynbosensis]